MQELRRRSKQSAEKGARVAPGRLRGGPRRARANKRQRVSSDTIRIHVHVVAVVPTSRKLPPTLDYHSP